jgi:hypothetical protein
MRGRTTLVVLVAASVLAAACTSDGDTASEPAVGEGTGFADAEGCEGRRDAYLEFATTELDPDSSMNVLAHAERAERDAASGGVASAVTRGGRGAALGVIGGG